MAKLVCVECSSESGELGKKPGPHEVNFGSFALRGFVVVLEVDLCWGSLVPFGRRLVEPSVDGRIVALSECSDSLWLGWLFTSGVCWLAWPLPEPVWLVLVARACMPWPVATAPPVLDEQ